MELIHNKLDLDLSLFLILNEPKIHLKLKD